MLVQRSGTWQETCPCLVKRIFVRNTLSAPVTEMEHVRKHTGEGYDSSEKTGTRSLSASGDENVVTGDDALTIAVTSANEEIPLAFSLVKRCRLSARDERGVPLEKCTDMGPRARSPIQAAVMQSLSSRQPAKRVASSFLIQRLMIPR